MGRTHEQLMDMAGRKWDRKSKEGKDFFAHLNELRDSDPQAARQVKRAMAKFHKKETAEEQQDRFAHQDKILHARAKAMDPDKREKFLAKHAERRAGFTA
jgi:hypothetical protein